MAIFGGGDRTPTAVPAIKSPAAGATSLSIVGAGMTVIGDIETGGVVKIEGTVTGHVRAGQQVLVAKGGRIDGDIDTGEAVIAGVVHGAVHTGQRLEIQAGAVVEGDVATKRILVAEGAVLNGLVRMGDDEDVARRSSSNPAVSSTLPRPGGSPEGGVVSPQASTPH